MEELITKVVEFLFTEVDAVEWYYHFIMTYAGVVVFQAICLIPGTLKGKESKC